jgi:hypothetical protein
MSGAVATNLDGNCPKAEMPDAAIDGSTPIKWVDLHIRPLLLDLGKSVQVVSFQLHYRE